MVLGEKFLFVPRVSSWNGKWESGLPAPVALMYSTQSPVVGFTATVVAALPFFYCVGYAINPEISSAAFCGFY